MSDSFYNPALTETPRQQPASVIPLQRDTSILEWLEAQGRLVDRDDKDSSFDFDASDSLAEELLGSDDYNDEEEEFEPSSEPEFDE
jgi:hypothetical protein